MSGIKNYDQKFNILVLGYPNEIKDSLLSRFAGKEYDTTYISGPSFNMVRFIY